MADLYPFVLHAASELIAEKQYDRAADLLEQILRHDPRNREAQEKLGILRTLERRRARRFSTDILACVRAVGQGDEDQGGSVARILDVGRMGAGLVAPGAIPEGKRCTLGIESGFSLDHTLQLMATVVWTRKEGDVFRLGVEFERLSRDQMVGLLEAVADHLFSPAGKEASRDGLSHRGKGKGALEGTRWAPTRWNWLRGAQVI